MCLSGYQRPSDGSGFRPPEGLCGGLSTSFFKREGATIFWQGGGAPDDAVFARIMAEENYVLQYHLYVMALHVYLQDRVPEYHYDTHFGAVYYVFLRGLDPEREPGWGVFRARPTPSLIERMMATLLP